MTSKKQRIIKKRFTDMKNLLTKRLKDYEDGDHTEAYQIASLLRVLLHDTRQSKSILKQMNSKDKIMFQSTAGVYNPLNLIAYTGLVMMRMTVGKGVEYIGKSRDENPGSFNGIMYYKFDDWWAEVVVDDKKRMYTRKDLVLHVANKEGGSHLDIEVQNRTYKLFYENSVGWKSIVEDKQGNVISESDPINNLVLESIYEIGIEVVNSFKEFDILLDYNLNEIRQDDAHSYYGEKSGKKIFLNYNQSLDPVIENALDNANFNVHKKNMYKQVFTVGNNQYKRYLVK